MSNDYEINESGIITSPGKFEGEAAYIPYFWDMADADLYDGETPVSRFDISAEDVEKFNTLKPLLGQVLLLWETDSGFVESNIVSVEEADRIQAECEADSTSDDDSDENPED